MNQPEELSAQAHHTISSNICQIVRDDYKYNEGIKEEMAKWPGDFLSLGYDYNIVSVLGPQSGGKSTLFNLLFGTEFQVMDVKSRKQTTKGLWLAHDMTKKVLVMDVEGTDSKERGDKHINFDRKSALFSLALSEVLIINMWATDVGRYTASNYGTLKMVFELHLKLFYKEGSPKTLLLFILRDHSTHGGTPLESLAHTLDDDMHHMWNEIQKPEHLQGRTIDEFFDFQFIGLANFIYEKPRFMDQVNDLVRRFGDYSQPDAFFKPQYSKRIPADGLPLYASRIWNTILSEKDLDLPSVKEMLATVRCEEIASAALAETRKRLEPYRNKLERGTMVESFGSKLKEEVAACLADYESKASLYAENVYQARLEQLEVQLMELTEPLKQLMARTVMDTITRELEVDMTSQLTKIMALADFTMWKEVGEVHMVALRYVQSRLQDLANELDAENSQTEMWLEQSQQTIEGLVKRKARDEASEKSLKARLVERFKEHFMYVVEDGVSMPREFTPDVDIPAVYKAAIKETIPLVDLFAYFDLPSSNGVTQEKIVLLTETEVLTHKKRLEDYVADLYKQAKNDQRGNVSMSAMPVWVFVVIFLLGFNEIMWFVKFITNPGNLIFLFLAIVVLGSAYVLHQAGMLGAAEAVLMAVIKESLSQLNMGLGSFVERMQEGGLAKSTNHHQKKNE